MNAGSGWPSNRGVAYAKTVAEAMKLELDMNNPAGREKLDRNYLEAESLTFTPKR
jgi:hypothetical protein